VVPTFGIHPARRSLQVHDITSAQALPFVGAADGLRSNERVAVNRVPGDLIAYLTVEYNIREGFYIERMLTFIRRL
jgi:hypothetical protein